MKTDMRLNSTDSHVLEPADLWTTRLDRKLREHAPRVVAEATGDWWQIDGIRVMSVTGATDTGLRFEHQEKMRLEGRSKDIRPGAQDPAAKLKDMDIDGVHGEVVYPTIGLQLWRLENSELLNAIFSSYNDYIAEFCSAAPDRLKGVAMINLDDIGQAITEVKRCAAKGLKGALISVYPGEDRPYSSREYDRFWATAEESDIPLSLHIGTNRRLLASASEAHRAAMGTFKLHTTPVSYTLVDRWVRESLGHMIFSGIFERFPKLKVLSLEHETSWAPYFIRAMDYHYTQRPLRPEWPRFKSTKLPSDFFHTNVCLSFQEDDLGIRMRDIIGVENLVWGSDYPHPESTFPRSHQILEKAFAGVPELEQEKILRLNAAELYGFA